MDETKGNRLTDQLLVARVLGGDTGAFRYIIEDTEGIVAQIIFKMIPNLEDRKDIAQDVYLKVFHNLSRFKFQSKLSTWIWQITYNTCLNYLEKKKLFLFDNLINASAVEEESDGLPELFENLVEKKIMNDELSRILSKEIDKLSPVYKTLITLYHHEDLSYAEIATIVQLPEGTVKSYLFRARKTLRDQLILVYKKDAL
ncbi:RNA polymerase sigma factor [Salmonirosea aquatica]|uniref:Sigma-70 family RNA polymerase sigma factor n=1 Tax=Salmonirosea aquatica TaxID=2654236 RepID=A0A7C9FBB0_9BACT|nr:sigma-70 family RNA polymerase sigma factor [Cytophagaceae bacterium SJW1-29]